jgi:hypothetical protein
MTMLYNVYDKVILINIDFLTSVPYYVSPTAIAACSYQSTGINPTL